MLEPTARLSPPLHSAWTAIRTATEGMTDDQMAWHPEGKWSTAEILEHLSLAYSRTAERMQSLLADGLSQHHRRTLTEWLATIIVLKLGRIPVATKAQDALVPKGMSPAGARISVEQNLHQLDRMIERCGERFGWKTSVLAHPAFGPLSTSSWRRFHCVHTFHHTKQIQALRKKMKDSEDRA